MVIIIRKILPHFFIFILSIFICGTFSLLTGKELSWDLANYHYYNPYAFLHQRMYFDYWPSSFVQVYLNPAIDFLTYFLIQSFSPIKTMFILGAIHGMNIVLLFYIARSFLSDDERKFSFSLLLAILGVYGPTALPGMGSFQNDNLISLFILSFVLLQLIVLTSYEKRNQLSKKMIMLSGIILGAGTGLKLTAGIFVLGAFFSFLFFPFRSQDKIKLLFLWGTGLSLGFLLCSGYWMLTLFHQYHNPFFPFLNGVFHSPQFPANNWHDERFMPKNSWQTLFFPFYFSWDGRTSDVFFRDFRFLIVYVLFAAFLIKLFFSAQKNKLNKNIYWLFLFFIFSYVIWQFSFSMMRYLVTLEMLSPLIIYLLVKQLITNSHARFSMMTIIFSLLIFSLIPSTMIRAPWYETDFFNVKLPSIVNETKKATVLMAYPAFSQDLRPRPHTYLVPFFPAEWRFIGVPFSKEKFIAIDEKTKQLVRESKDHFYLITSEAMMPELFRAAHSIGLTKNGKCYSITSDRQRISNEATLLCEVTAH